MDGKFNSLQATVQTLFTSIADLSRAVDKLRSQGGQGKGLKEVSALTISRWASAWTSNYQQTKLLQKYALWDFRFTPKTLYPFFCAVLLVFVGQATQQHTIST